MLINISEINNFIKLINNNFEINIFFYIENDIICNNTLEYIDFDKYLIKLFKKTSNKYNFYIDTLNNNQLTKIQKNINLFKKNIKIIEYNFDINLNKKIDTNINFNLLNNIIHNYYQKIDFNQYTLNIFNDLLKNVVSELNNLINFKYSIILDKITDITIQLIMDNIFKNYYINNLILLIDSCKKLIEYINNNIKLIKQSDFDYQNIDNHYDILKYIYINKKYIIDHLIYITEFLDIYNIMTKIFNNNIKKNIIYIKYSLGSIFLCLLIKYFNFKIIYKDTSDILIDNNSLQVANNLFKNIDIINISSLDFLIKYLYNDINCIEIDDLLLN
jgi:hypothetical protein